MRAAHVVALAAILAFMAFCWHEEAVTERHKAEIEVEVLRWRQAAEQAVMNHARCLDSKEPPR